MTHQKTKLLVSSTINTVKTAVVIWTTALFVGGVVLAVATVSSGIQPTGTISFSTAPVKIDTSVTITINATAPTGSKITGITVKTGDFNDSKKYTKSCSAKTCKYTFSKTYDATDTYNVKAEIVSMSSSKNGAVQKIYINKNIVVERGVSLLGAPRQTGLLELAKADVTTGDWVYVSVEAAGTSYSPAVASVVLYGAATESTTWECYPSVSSCGQGEFDYYSPYLYDCVKALGGYAYSCSARFKFKLGTPGQYTLSARIWLAVSRHHSSFGREWWAWHKGGWSVSNSVTLNVTGDATTPGDPGDPTTTPTESPKPVPPSVSVSAIKADPVCTSAGCTQSVTITATGYPGDNPISSISLSEVGGSSLGSEPSSSMTITKSYSVSDTPLFKTFQATVTDDKGLLSKNTASVTLMVPKDLTGTLDINSPIKLGGTIAIVARLNNKDAKVNLELVPGSGDKSLLKSTSFSTQNCKSSDGKTCSTPFWNIGTDSTKSNPRDQTYTFKATFYTSDNKSTTATANLIIKKKDASQCPF